MSEELEQKRANKYLPISGRELAQVLLGVIAEKLVDSQWLNEGLAYPGAKVEIAVRISPEPREEGRVIAWQDQVTVDLKNPPDVVRILSGLPVWEKIKIALDGVDVQIEKPVAAREEVVEAAKQVAGVKATPGGGRK